MLTYHIVSSRGTVKVMEGSLTALLSSFLVELKLKIRICRYRVPGTAEWKERDYDRDL